MNNLPLELVEAIIGHVDEKDDISRSHLLSCSLVCRFWVPSSQRLLFHHIKFGPHAWRGCEQHPRVQRLDDVLRNSPHLTSYVRVLDLPDLSSEQLSACNKHRIAIDKLLSSLLPKFTHVQKLNISGLAWDVLGGDFRQSLCRVLELPSMVSVCISHAEFHCMDGVINIIKHARGLTGLTGLTLAGLCFEYDTSRMSANPVALEDTQADDDKLSHLTRLNMMFGSNNFVLLNWLLGPRSHLGVSHIHTLHIRLPNSGANDSVNQLLRAIGGSLKHALFSMPNNFRLTINLKLNVNIEILSLIHTGMDSGILSTLGGALSTIDASNHIQRMELRVDPNYPHIWVDWKVWEELCNILTEPRFQFLELHINIRHDCILWNSLGNNVGKSTDMTDAYALLEKRGRRVFFDEPIRHLQCIFCHTWPSTVMI
ncbi:hypothetical protein JB92DRAFT_695966 [Gautieria morchelliformis]|nr:hypothetical protein JB92DRAFT_695966 [Gautieria morchelliformis]